MDDETLTISFRKPIEDKGVTHDQVILREPTAGELAETDGLEGYASDLRIISVVGGLPESTVRKMQTREFLQATRFLGGFMLPAPATGAAA